MKNKHKPSEDDQLLFKNAMEDVKPLKQGNYEPPLSNAVKKSLISPNKQIDDELDEILEASDYLLSDAKEHQTVNSDEQISYIRDGLQPKTYK